MEKDEIVRKLAAITGVSVSEIEDAIDRSIETKNGPQPCWHHGPIKDFCRATKCTDCDTFWKRKRRAY